jgi:lipid-A-disaccharide synthase
VISILPFEKGWYAEQGIEHVEYVGSPLAREVQPTVTKDEFCRKYKLDPDKPIVSLLPGSRRKEVTRILPVMIDAASRKHSVDSRIQIYIAAASDTHLTDIASAVQYVATGSLPENLITVCDDTFNALKASDAAAVASGTATLETGIIGTPMAIVYKTSALNYRLLRPLIDVDHFGLINLIAEERIATELIQDEFTGESLAAELFRILVPDENARVRKRLQVATDKLGHGGASRRAAEAILKLVGG